MFLRQCLHSKLGRQNDIILVTNLVDDLYKATAVSEVTIMQVHISLLVCCSVRIQMFNASCIRLTRSSNNSMHLIAILKQQLGQIGPILTSDALIRGKVGFYGF